MNTAPQLIYCYDPMCSWCWGFQPTWKVLQQELGPLLETGEITIRPLLGGLASDSNDPMPTEIQAMLKSTWQRIESQLGTEFNYDFWTNCQPRRSTYPACRACLVARNKGLESEITAAIETAYYLEAKNASDIETLALCAEQVGMHRASFISAMHETKVSGRLEAEIQEARQMGLNSFPSLAVIANDRIVHIELDYQNPQKMAAEIKRVLTKLA